MVLLHPGQEGPVALPAALLLCPAPTGGQPEASGSAGDPERRCSVICGLHYLLSVGAEAHCLPHRWVCLVYGTAPHLWTFHS